MCAGNCLDRLSQIGISGDRPVMLPVGANPEADEFALDAPVSPAGVLVGQAQDQVTEVVADRWLSGPVGVGPVPADRPLVPGQQGGGVTIRCLCSSRGSAR